MLFYFLWNKIELSIQSEYPKLSFSLFNSHNYNKEELQMFIFVFLINGLKAIEKRENVIEDHHGMDIDPSSSAFDSFDFENYTSTPEPYNGHPPSLLVVLITTLGAVLIMILVTSILCIRKIPEGEGLDNPLLISRQQNLLQSYTQ